MGGTGIIDQFLETFTRYIDSGFGLLGGEVGYLATTLAAIDVTLGGLFWAWGGDGDNLARLFRRKPAKRGVRAGAARIGSDAAPVQDTAGQGTLRAAGRV